MQGLTENTPPAPCPACGGSGQLSSFKGESRFLLSVEECPLCCGTGLAEEMLPGSDPEPSTQTQTPR